MATDYTLPLRQGLITLFSADAALKAILQAAGGAFRAYDNVPPKSVFPYIRLGDGYARDYGTKTEPGQAFETMIHQYDQSPPDRGQRVINSIQARIYALMHEQAVALPSGSVYLCRFIDQITNNTDGLSWHGISRYMMFIE